MFRRRVYLHVYSSDSVRIKKNQALDDTLNKLRNAYVEGQREFQPASQKMIGWFMGIRENRNGKVKVTFKAKAIRDAKKYNGVFVLVTNKENDPFRALEKFWKREWIEDFFGEYKQRIGDRKYRVWDDLTLNGKKLVQFIALCYYEYFSSEISRIKRSLGVPNGQREHDLKINLDKEKQLKTWLENNSIQKILDWFDAVEKINVVTPYARQTWITETIERDRMFLDKLSVKL